MSHAVSALEPITVLRKLEASGAFTCEDKQGGPQQNHPTVLQSQNARYIVNTHKRYEADTSDRSEEYCQGTKW